MICIRAIRYFAAYHKNNFFHGDIKPKNIFVHEFNLSVSSDAGSLLYLGEVEKNNPDEPLYRITIATPFYSSPELRIKAFRLMSQDIKLSG